MTTYTDEIGSVFSNTFDALGRKTGVAITPAAGVSGTTAQLFAYDGLSRTTFAGDFVGSSLANLTFFRDSVGRVLEESQFYGSHTRNVTNTAFTSYPATGFTFPEGRLLSNSYDAIYRPTLARDATNGVNVAAWQFFGPSRTAEVTLGNGLICTWMNNARTNSAVQSSVANPTWGNQSSDRLGYDGAGRPITKRYLAGGINGTAHAYNTPSAVVGFTTEYDLASNKFFERPLHAEERGHLYEPFTNGSPMGGYDSLNRLRQYQRGTLSSTGGFGGNGGGSIATPIALPNTDTQRTYDLDSLGNWRRTVFTPDGGSQQTEIRQHNGLNEITRIQNGATQTNLLYDGIAGTSNGNLKNDGTRIFIWDALNRLMRVNRVSDGAVIGQYAYDALNRRVRKIVSNGGLSGTIPNGTTDCIYSGWRCVEERDGGNGLIAQYIWGIYLDELLQQYNFAAINGFSASTALYPLQDLLYRTTGLADSSGVVREAYDTDAYGNTLIFRNSGSPPSAITWSDTDTQVNYPTCPFIFTGQRFDAETQTYFYKRRSYVPRFGRFASRDRSVARIGVNLFAYASSRPTVFVDPSGRDERNPVTRQPVAGGSWRPDRPTSGPFAPPNGSQQSQPPEPAPSPVSSGAYSTAADPFDPAFDPDAATMDQNWTFLLDFLSGSGATNRFYGPNSLETFQMRQSPGAAKLRNIFYAHGCRSIGGVEYGTGEAFNDTVLLPIASGGDLTDTSTQVGGFGDATAINNGDGTVTFTIPNYAGRQSFLYHLVRNKKGPGSMRTIKQTFQWKENIDTSKCCHNPAPSPSPTPVIVNPANVLHHR